MICTIFVTVEEAIQQLYFGNFRNFHIFWSTCSTSQKMYLDKNNLKETRKKEEKIYVRI